MLRWLLLPTLGMSPWTDHCYRYHRSFQKSISRTWSSPELFWCFQFSSWSRPSKPHDDETDSGHFNQVSQNFSIVVLPLAPKAKQWRVNPSCETEMGHRQLCKGRRLPCQINVPENSQALFAPWCLAALGLSGQRSGLEVLAAWGAASLVGRVAGSSVWQLGSQCGHCSLPALHLFP